MYAYMSNISIRVLIKQKRAAPLISDVPPLR